MLWKTYDTDIADLKTDIRELRKTVQADNRELRVMNQKMMYCFIGFLSAVLIAILDWIVHLSI